MNVQSVIFLYRSPFNVKTLPVSSLQRSNSQIFQCKFFTIDYKILQNQAFHHLGHRSIDNDFYFPLFLD